jgi:hypothetical protein
MTKPAQPGPPVWMSRVYDVMLLAYPPSFRREYGAEMKMVFRDRVRSARPAGVGVLPALLIRVIVDALRTAVLEWADLWANAEGHTGGVAVISLFAANNIVRVPDAGEQSGMVWLLLSSLGAFLLVDGWVHWLR